jgi:hypothetical protein
MVASYSSSPYFEFYFESFEKILLRKNDFLLDLNMELTKTILEILKMKTKISFSTRFEPPGEMENDFRYKITPKEKSQFSVKEYFQVFNNSKGAIQGLSIIDLIFNMGPEAVKYL